MNSNQLVNLLFKKVDEELAYIAIRKKLVAQMKEWGLIPEDYREVYTVAGREIT